MFFAGIDEAIGLIKTLSPHDSRMTFLIEGGLKPKVGNKGRQQRGRDRSLRMSY